MDVNDLVFDETLEIYTRIDGIHAEAYIKLSDGLAAAEELLTENYKKQIVRFINSAAQWQRNAVLAVKEWASKEYQLDEVPQSDVQLMTVYILYEQDQEERYGLLFRVAFDVEHGCGLKMQGNGFQVLEIGEGDVAFC